MAENPAMRPLAQPIALALWSGHPVAPPGSMVGLIAAAAALESSSPGLRALLDGVPR